MNIRDRYIPFPPVSQENRQVNCDPCPSCTILGKHALFFFFEDTDFLFFLIGLCRVLVATRGIFQLGHAGSSSLTRAPCAGSAV